MQTLSLPGPRSVRSAMALNWAKSCGKNRIGGWDQVAEDNAVMSLVPHLRAVGGSLD